MESIFWQMGCAFRDGISIKLGSIDMFKTASLLGCMLLAAPSMHAYAAGIQGDTVQVQFTQIGRGPQSVDLGSFTVLDTPTDFNFGGLKLSIDSSELIFSVLSAQPLIGSTASFVVTKTTGGNFAGGLTEKIGESGAFYSTVDNVFKISVSGIVLIGLSSFAIPSPVLPAVPEPETYAMLLAGLGLMGTLARRRQRADVRCAEPALS